MKKQIIFLILILFSTGAFAQSDTFTKDEVTRIKYSIHLITYDTMSRFDNANGEAYYDLVIYSFKENLSIPQINLSSISLNDKAKIEKFIQQLNDLKQNPPTWDDLFTRQLQYLIWLDKVSRRKSKYKLP